VRRHSTPSTILASPSDHRRTSASFACAATLFASLIGVAVLGGCERRGESTSPTEEDEVAIDVDENAPPIAWQDWEREAFESAAAERRLILVTVVADWCHWCHVMDEKTYTNAAIRTLLGRHFVAVRVEADARPDLAERYSQWGWPALAVLTPDARPVLELRGYQEADEFAELLHKLARAEADGTLKGRVTPPKKALPERPLASVRDGLIAQLDNLYDEEEHGWGHRQKYPIAGGIEHALLRSHLRAKDKEWETLALATLERELMLVDPVWGGMYQYSVRGVWDRPHFEKIGKVQVGALSSFALAYRRTGDARWLAAIDAEIGYLRDHMLSETGGFYSSQDADLREGETTIPGDVFYAKDDAGRRALGEPKIDRRIFADLGGGFISALCTVHAVDRRPEGERSPALELATAAAEHLLRAHLRSDGAFRHDADVDDPKIYLRDQTAVGRGLIGLYRATGERRYLDHARTLGDRILSDLQDPDTGGFFAHSADPEAVGVFAERRRPLEENGEAARFLIELERLVDHLAQAENTSEGGGLPYIAAARTALLSLADPKAIKREGRMITSYLLAVEEVLFTGVDVTIVAADPKAREDLLAAALASDEPRKSVEISPPGERYPDIQRAAAYICSDSACSTPITDPTSLAQRIEAFTADLDRD